MFSKYLFLDYLRNVGGNFAILTSLMIVPLVLFSGMAVDVSNAFDVKSDMQSIADSAALAGAKVFKGTNKPEAVAAAGTFVSGKMDKLPSGTTYSVAIEDGRVNVEVSGGVENAFLKIAGIETFPVKVSAEAAGTLKPNKIIVTPLSGSGWYYKQASIMVRRAAGQPLIKLATMTYQPESFYWPDVYASFTISPSGPIDLGTFTEVLIVIDIKNDSCPLNHRGELYYDTYIYCYWDTSEALSKYDLTIRSDNPEQSHYLFVNGKQMPQGKAIALFDASTCGTTTNHAWEDGGGFDVQDLFYKIEVHCNPDGAAPRLIR